MNSRIHPDPFPFIAPNDPEVIWVVPDSWFERWSQEPARAGRVYRWSDTPKQTHIRKVVLEAEEQRTGGTTALPGWILELPEIEQLRMPLRLLADLKPRPDLLRGSLETDGWYNLRLEYEMPHLQWLRPNPNSEIAFTPSQLPALRNIRIRVDSKGRNLRTLPQHPHLEFVELKLVRTRDPVFDTLAELPQLRFVSLQQGDRTSLAGIAQLSALTDLYVYWMNQLSDVRDAKTLERLERLTFTHTPKLDLAPVVSWLTRLAGLEVTATGDLGLTPVDQDMLTESIPNLILGDCSMEVCLPRRARAAKRAAKNGKAK
jgi:hypothetical protein